MFYAVFKFFTHVLLSCMGCRRKERGHGDRAAVSGRHADQTQEAGDSAEGAGLPEETEHAQSAPAA